MIDASIVIPAYNASKTISKTIEACLAQDHGMDKLEIIVVDDGSADNTKEIVQRYPVKYIYQDKSGPARARNRGWLTAGGETIFFTDSDCIPEKSWVLKTLSDYTSEDIGAVGGSYGIANPESLLADCVYQEIVYRHAKMPKKAKALGSYNLSVRRKALEEVGGYDERYRMASGEDNDLSYKILEKGYYLIFDKDIKVLHYHPTGLIRYLKSQAWHGFWRVKLYMDHPAMAKGDDYSSVIDYIQPSLSLAILGLIPTVFYAPARALLLFLLTLEALLQLPFAIVISKDKKDARYFFLAVVTFLRGFSRGIGMAGGILNFMILRGRR